jgi:acyl-CoA synthetase (AMP-forming)/AMP-acid ligase II
MNVIQSVREHATNLGTKPAFCFLNDDFSGHSFRWEAHIADAISYAQLAEQALKLGWRLEQLGLRGERIVLPYIRI